MHGADYMSYVELFVYYVYFKGKKSPSFSTLDFPYFVRILQDGVFQNEKDSCTAKKILPNINLINILMNYMNVKSIQNYSKMVNIGYEIFSDFCQHSCKQNFKIKLKY